MFYIDIYLGSKIHQLGSVRIPSLLEKLGLPFI
jgi:hypothetical protein